MSDDTKRIAVNLSEIPIESSLGLLAIGDVAFTAWREAKKQSKANNVNIITEKKDNE